MTLAEIVEQLQSCNYQCEAGALENNVAFIELRRLAHISDEGTACANCHDPSHAFQIPRLEGEVNRLRSLPSPACSECRRVFEDHAALVTRAEALEAASAFYSQGLEMVRDTDYVDRASKVSHINHLLNTCDDGRLMLERYRLRIAEGDKATAQLATVAAILKAMIEQPESDSPTAELLPAIRKCTATEIFALLNGQAIGQPTDEQFDQKAMLEVAQRHADQFARMLAEEQSYPWNNADGLGWRTAALGAKNADAAVDYLVARGMAERNTNNSWWRFVAEAK